MQLSKNINTISTIIFILLIISFAIILFEITSLKATIEEINPNENTGNFIYLVFSFCLILTISMYALLLNRKITEVKEIITDSETGQQEIRSTSKKSKEEERKRLEKEKRIKQEAEKNKIIEKLVEDLDKQSSLKRYTDKFLSNLAKEYAIVQGLFFLRDKEQKIFKMVGNYAFYSEQEPREFELGEGISGQVAKNKELIYIDNVPDNYITVLSGLGAGSPKHLLIFPILYREESIGVIELASFERLIQENLEDILMGVSRVIGPQIISKF